MQFAWEITWNFVLRWTSLANILLFVDFHPRRKNRRPSKVANHAARVIALHHRQPANVAIQHFCERRIQRLVRKRDHQIHAAGFGHRHLRLLLLPERANNVAPRDDADEPILIVHNQSSLSPTQVGIAESDQIRKLRKFHRGGDARHVFVHHIAHAREFKRVNAVFARDVMAAPGELFGEDGTAHEQHGHGQAPRRNR